MATNPFDGPLKVLLVEDDLLDRRMLLAENGRGELIHVACASSGEEVLDRLADGKWDAVTTGLSMRDMDGADLTQRIRERDPLLPVLIVAANASVDRAADGLRAGATGYLLEPIDPQHLISVLKLAARVTRHRSDGDLADARLVGTDPRMEEVRRFARQIAAVPSARVLITGASGTGKSLLARVIHELSGATGDFVVINCAALPAHLLESELFGHEKGAFTDAQTRKTGLIETAREGTLLLDEIGAMPLDLQAKLLLFLENQEVRRLGGTRSQPVRARVIAATNEDLHAGVRDRTFRGDLLYRLDVASIELPRMAEMPTALEELSARVLLELCARLERPMPELTDASFTQVTGYGWPGNVRELRNVIERALLFHEKGPLILKRPDGSQTIESGVMMPHGITLAEVERRYVKATMEANPDTDYVKLASRLGIARKTLWEKRRRYGL